MFGALWVKGTRTARSWIKTNFMSRPDSEVRVADGRTPVAAAERVPESGLNGSDTGSTGSSMGSGPPRSGGSSRRGLMNWRVRSRLLLLIAIPTLTALVLGGAPIASAVQSAFAFQRAEERAVLASNITQLAQRLETERDQTIYYIALGKTGRAGELSTATPAALKRTATQQYRVIQAFYRQTDQAIARFRALLVQFRGAYSSAAQPEVASALAELNNLNHLRQASTLTLLPPLVVVQKYTALIDNLIVIEKQTDQGTADPVLSQTLEVLGPVSRMKEAASEQRAILSAALLQGTLDQAEASALTAAQASQQSSQQTFNTFATGPQREQWDNTVSGSFVYLAASQEQQASRLQARTHSLVGDPITADAFYDAMSTGITQMGSVERSLAADVITRANSLRDSADVYALLVGLAVVMVLALALIFTMMVGRSMVQPLWRLRMGALEVAGVRLPETVRRMGEGGAAEMPEAGPIDVDSADEIGDVARAFDQVHREAVRLASNEAALRGNVNAMFVNLSRRSQSLVSRQIRLIDDLEQGEEEPGRLASFFQMDHLATQMRRYSENLLVLAGQEVTQRWTQAVALVDVVRAAVSEIEQYERVTLDVQPGISVHGVAVTDVVHLLSELVENATSFSAGGTPVEVSGHGLSSGGALFAVTDEGVGMDSQEMAHANWRLDNPPVVDVSVSRRMGLFVVARLAARHGIRVRLRHAPMGGVTALVWLPDEIISHEGTASPPRPHRFENRATGPVAAPLRTSRLPDSPGTGRPGDGVAAIQAVSAARNPRPAPQKADTDDTATFAVVGPDTSVASPEEVEVRPAGDVVAAARAEGADVTTPPALAAGEENRLPIFESVESDWFRRGRRGADAPAPAGNRAADDWISPADEGWRIAEGVIAPVTGGMTIAGLPIRVPKANLVPGSAGAPVSTQPTSSRSPSQTRERLASFQRGIQEGRAATHEEISSGEEHE
jgi:signal transduction histidine kinase